MNTGAAFIGIGYSAIERNSDRSLLSYAHDAALDALRDAGIDRDSVDGYVGIGSNPNPSFARGDGADHVSAHLMVDSLGLGPLGFAADVSGFAITMASAAASAIAAGRCSVVLGVRAVYAGSGGNSPGVIDAAGEEQWMAPFGAGAGGTRFGMRMRDYMERSGAGRADVYGVIAAARDHARDNPVAIFQHREVTLEEYLEAPMISEPLSLFDCDLPVSGAGAFVMVASDVAESLARPAAHVTATANWTDADSILERAGLQRSDIDVCQLYDGYSFMLYEWLERLGWCDEFTAWKFVAEGSTRRDGPLPVNTFGGALGEGRLHGMGHLREGIAQVRGTAGPRQIDDVEHCLVQIGPFDRSALAVLSREAR